MKIENLIYKDSVQLEKDAKNIISRTAIGMSLNRTWNPTGSFVGQIVQETVSRCANSAFDSYATEEMKNSNEVHVGARLGSVLVGSVAGSLVARMLGFGTPISSLVASTAINYLVNMANKVEAVLKDSKDLNDRSVVAASAATQLTAAFTVNGMANAVGADISMLGLVGAVALNNIWNFKCDVVEKAKEKEAESKSTVVQVNKENFQQEVLNSKQPVVVDAYATWCPPCKMLAPIFRELSGEMKGYVKFAKFNTDDNLELTKDLEIQAMPTLIFYKDGKEVARQTGALDKEDLATKIEETLWRSEMKLCSNN